MESGHEQLALRVGTALKQRGLLLVTAESCTGGWVGATITAIPGSSHWYERGFITYSNTAKQEMLGVGSGVLERFGAVSEETVRAMAEGALERSRAGISIAISGIAGPGGATADKPVGTVCLAWTARDRETRSHTGHFRGDREAVRHQAVSAALQGLLDFLAAGE